MDIIISVSKYLFCMFVCVFIIYIYKYINIFIYVYYIYIYHYLYIVYILNYIYILYIIYIRNKLRPLPHGPWKVPPMSGRERGNTCLLPLQRWASPIYDHTCLRIDAFRRWFVQGTVSGTMEPWDRHRGLDITMQNIPPDWKPGREDAAAAARHATIGSAFIGHMDKIIGQQARVRQLFGRPTASQSWRMMYGRVLVFFGYQDSFSLSDSTQNSWVSKCSSRLYIQSYLLSEMFGTAKHLLRRPLGAPNIYSQDIWRILGV